LDNLRGMVGEMSDSNTNEGDLRVWWVPQIPGKPFLCEVASLSEAKLIIEVLADYDRFQFENNIKPDYCNAGGLSEYQDGEWSDWYDHDGSDFREWCDRR
jgi:superinfection exclusion protein gp17